jgi:hypothetical protein
LLSQNALIGKYSEKEQALLDMLSLATEPLSSTHLVNAYYGNEIPVNAHKIIIDRLRQIAKKAEFYSEPFRVRKSKRQGPKPITFWLESHRKRRARA